MSHSGVGAHNSPLLKEIERRGGGYVWEDDIFAVHLMDVSLQPDDVPLLTGLIGVKEIYVDAANMGLPEMKAFASIPGLEHLGIARWVPGDGEFESILKLCEGARLIPDAEL